MKTRLDLQNALEAFIKNDHVYFQPPEDKKLEYDCIVYSFAGIKSQNGDNKKYFKYRLYKVTIITKSYNEDIIPNFLDSFEYSSIVNSFKSDGLYHFDFNLYF